MSYNEGVVGVIIKILAALLLIGVILVGFALWLAWRLLILIVAYAIRWHESRAQRAC